MSNSETFFQLLATQLDNRFNGNSPGGNKVNGFVLLAFPLQNFESTIISAISNLEDTKSVIIALKSAIAALEGQSVQSGKA